MRPATFRKLVTLLACGCSAFAYGAAPEAVDLPTVIVIVGAEGEPAFGEDFGQQAKLWSAVTQRAGGHHIAIGLDEQADESGDLDRVKEVFSAEPKEGVGELWIVLIGHGTFDGKEAKFNLRGTDLSATELAVELQPFQRPVAVINTASASAPFINRISAPGRVIVSATRSGNEQNFTRFGRHMADAISDPGSDLDKDGQTSLLEAFLTASNRVAEFYKTEGRLATEHGLIDDNGDGLGTPSEWFRGIRATRQAQTGAATDGTRAHQFHLVRSREEQRLSPEIRARRDEIELQLARLREQKSEQFIDDYYLALERLLLELARLYDSTGGDS